jgi:hypothetical protein
MFACMQPPPDPPTLLGSLKARAGQLTWTWGWMSRVSTTAGEGGGEAGGASSLEYTSGAPGGLGGGAACRAAPCQAGELVTSQVILRGSSWLQGTIANVQRFKGSHGGGGLGEGLGGGRGGGDGGGGRGLGEGGGGGGGGLGGSTHLQTGASTLGIRAKQQSQTRHNCRICCILDRQPEQSRPRLYQAARLCL